ncbi:hypothetical protein [Sulfurospirillum arcachonense]|uniref:hypothetical protein n=1 Tax=Sulfurospirillum arcachonense TaxID=57666 RepID=UPI00046A5667|nr:hypothetical protein [Sulfurospirillum arcachonense]
MKINGSSANSINFIEQKKSNTSYLKTANNTLKEPIDTFEAKTVFATNLLESNESVGILQTAEYSIKKLKNNNEELQKLTEKYEYFKSQKSELNEKFEEITINMLDIVDNTTFKDTQLFYTTHTFNSGNSEFSLALPNEYGIEDFSIDNRDELNTFSNKLEELTTKISSIKQNIEVAHFNQVAALNEHSPLLSQIENTILNKDDIQGAHDVSSLKDKLSFLLDD